jgi:hypothetical protein
MQSAEMLVVLRAVRLLLVEVNRQVEIAEEGGDEDIDYWRRAYDAVFFSGELSLITRIGSELKKLDMRFPDYCDPDTTYEEDVRAYAVACISCRETVQRHIDSLYRTGALHED